MLIRCRRLSFSSESQIRCTTHNSATNANSLQKTQFRQQTTNSLQTTQFRQWISICYSRHSFNSESQFCCTTHNSTANANSLQKTQFRQRITNSLQTTQFRQQMLIHYSRHSFGSESQFRCTTHNSAWTHTTHVVTTPPYKLSLSSSRTHTLKPSSSAHNPSTNPSRTTINYNI